MLNDRLKVPKILKEVVLWVHPEGRVVGALYLRKQSAHHAGAELPFEALNQPDPFIVFRCDNSSQLRFYNRRTIIRVEYPGRDPQVARALKPLACQLHMMDGCLISGTIEEPLHPDRARLLDYLNNMDANFIKLYVDETTVLVNKSYIIHVHVENLDDATAD